MKNPKSKFILPILVFLTAIGVISALWGPRIFRSEDSRPRLSYPYPLTVQPSNPDTEIAFHEKRVQLNPTSGMELASLAQAYLSKARQSRDSQWYEKAEATAKQSLAILTYSNAPAKLVLASISQAGHDFAASLRLVEEVLREDFQNADALSLQVTSLLGMGHGQAAVQPSETLAKLSPSLGSFALRALVKLRQGQDSEALLDFHRALRLEDIDNLEGSAWVRSLIGRYYYHRGDYPYAQELFQEALRIRPDFPLALGLLAELHATQDRLDSAEQFYFRAFEVSGEPSYLVDRAKVKVKRGDATGAEVLRGQAEQLMRAELKRGSFGHRGELAHLLLDRGRPADVAEAIALCEAEAKQRRDPETLETLAWAYSSSGRWPEAQGAMQEALSSGLRDAAFFHRAGVIEQQLGNSHEAKKYFTLAQQVNPNM